MRRLRQESNSYLSDEELLSRFYSDHENKWLGILLPRYSLLLFGVCMKYLKNEENARDSVQQIFLKVISQLHKYNVSNFKSWIYMVAKNYCLMKLRDQNHAEVEWKDSINPADEEPERMQINMQKEDLLNLLHENIKKLKHEQQICIDYFYMQKKSYVEIAELTGYSVLQVKSYLQNGKRKLELLMKEYKSKNFS